MQSSARYSGQQVMAKGESKSWGKKEASREEGLPHMWIISPKLWTDVCSKYTEQFDEEQLQQDNSSSLKIN
jgi:peroxiredoxin